MIDIQNIPAGNPCQNLSYPGEYDRATIVEHVALLIEECLVKGEIYQVWPDNSFLIDGLTWKGHDFIEAAKDDSIWLKATKTLFLPTVSITFDLLLQWLKAEAKQKLGLP
jgi:hypothetical protein